jgi:hypothetical protein
MLIKGCNHVTCSIKNAAGFWFKIYVYADSCVFVQGMQFMGTVFDLVSRSLNR